VIALVDVSTLQPGDVVKIVDEWCDGCKENPAGLMDRWLGKVMTVRSVCNEYDYVLMEEDENTPEWPGGWAWFSPAIDYVVNRIDCNLTQPTSEEFKRFIFGKAGDASE